MWVDDIKTDFLENEKDNCTMHNLVVGINKSFVCLFAAFPSGSKHKLQERIEQLKNAVLQLNVNATDIISLQVFCVKFWIQTRENESIRVSNGLYIQLKYNDNHENNTESLNKQITGKTIIEILTNIRTQIIF